MSKKTKRLEKENASLSRKHDATNQSIIKMAEERTSVQKELQQMRKKNENLESLCRGMQAQGRVQPPLPPPQDDQGTDQDDEGTESEYDYSEDEEGSLDDDEYDESDENIDPPISLLPNKPALSNDTVMASRSQPIMGNSNAIKT